MNSFEWSPCLFPITEEKISLLKIFSISTFYKYKLALSVPSNFYWFYHCLRIKLFRLFKVFSTLLQGGPVLRYKKVLPIRYKKGSSIRYNHPFFAKFFKKGSPIRYNRKFFQFFFLIFKIFFHKLSNYHFLFFITLANPIESCGTFPLTLNIVILFILFKQIQGRCL